MSNQTSKSFTKNPEVFLLHIRDFSVRIQTYVEGLSFEDFKENQEVQDAVYFNFVKIGEAITKLVDEFEDKTDIPFAKIKAFRNQIVHEYWEVDLAIVWTIIQVDLPRLMTDLQPFIDAIDESAYDEFEW